MGGGGDNKIEETPQQRALARASMNRWNDYQQYYRPVENRFMEQVNDMNADGQYSQAANMASIPVEQQFSQAVTQNANQMIGAGINPNSGLFKAELDKLDRNKASVKADMMSQGQMAQQNRYIGGLQNVVAIGQGQATTAMDGMGSISSMSAQKASSEAGLRQQSINDNRGMIGAAAGMATSYGLRQFQTDNGGGA